MNRLQAELDVPTRDSKVCQGTLLSRAQYLVDVDEWGYEDARLQPRGTMTPNRSPSGPPGSTSHIDPGRVFRVVIERASRDGECSDHTIYQPPLVPSPVTMISCSACDRTELFESTCARSVYSPAARFLN